MRKQQELTDPTSCLNRAQSDEPLFVLRAKDPLASMAVRHWITMALGVHEDEKRKEAHGIAASMDEWRLKWRLGHVPDAPAEDVDEAAS